MADQEFPRGASADEGRESSAGVKVAEIHFEHLYDTLGVGVRGPRLSWLVETEAAGWRQLGYELEAYGPDGQLRGQTGRVTSDESVLVAWPFAELESRERVAVRARVWRSDGAVSAWSELAWLEAGLFAPEDWSARFVTPAWEEDATQPQAAPLLRREFELRPGVERARLYVTGLGLYEMYLNGAVVGDHVLAPGWTSYAHRLRYQVFDVTEQLNEGRNALGALLGDGWYRGRFGFGGGRRNIYGDKLILLAQLEIVYRDGTTERVVTDESWRAAHGPVVSNSLYDGETYDARLELPGWSAPGYDEREWAGVRLVERDLATLVAPAGPPVRRIEEVAPVAITLLENGRVLLDFGQNLVGRLRLSVRGEAGQIITLRHAEVLEIGELCVRPLRTAQATDRYILRGGEVETWEPRFTFHGFRYAEVAGWPGELRAEDVRAIVFHSDLERTGWFECSDPLINRLHENVVWSMRGNFVDVPTDCPQRDERLGWTGDLQVFAPTASFLYDTAGFLQSWLADLAADQRDCAGIVPFVIPNSMGGLVVPTAAWSDVAVIVPWVLYQRYGDLEILATQFESMRAWVEVVAEKAGETRLWDTGFQFGDWLDPSAPPDKPGNARTDKYLLATAYFARSTELLGRAAELLGRSADAARYTELAAQIRAAFASEYVTPSGRLLSDATTAYALALQFDLLPAERQRQHAGQRLAALVRESDYHISTGFVGTPLICDALCGAGEFDSAFRLLTQQSCPSWLYPVTMGATTIWERWDSMLPDGSVNPGEMTSFNHYALGAVADWLHRVVGGLAPAAPGYRRLDIQPRPGGGLTHARARHRTPYGLAESAWRLEAGQITVEAVVPPNTTARVTLPGSDAAPFEVEAGTHCWSYQYQQPGARRAFTLESTMDDLLDHPAAWNAVTATILRFIPDMTPVIASLNRQSVGSLPLRQVLGMFPQVAGLYAALEAALADFS